MNRRLFNSRFYNIVAASAAVIGLAAVILFALVFGWTITKSETLGGISYWSLPGQPLVDTLLVVAGLASLLSGSFSIALAYGSRMARLQRTSAGTKGLAVASLTAAACSAVAAAVAVSAWVYMFMNMWSSPTPYDEAIAAIFLGGEVAMLTSGAISLTSGITALILRDSCGQKSAICNVAIVISALQFCLGIGLFFFFMGGLEVVHEGVSWFRSNAR